MASSEGRQKTSEELQTPRAPRARWILHVQATFWRALMAIGMLLHRLAPPRPPKPDFSRQITSTISGKPGMVTLHFYVPKDYPTQKRLYSARPALNDLEDASSVPVKSSDNGKFRNSNTKMAKVGDSIRRRSSGARKWGGYPAVINFHGGGFTLGTATDDARWCGTVVDECHAMVVSVDYRLAPECPFPTAVEDGADAVLWVHEHAEELGVDREKLAISGFSSGGNMAFTVPLRLYDEQTGFDREGSVQADDGTPSTSASASSSATKVPPDGENVEILDPSKPPPPPPPPGPGHFRKADTTITARNIPSVSIRCIVPWYPSLDYTRTRDQRRATNIRKDQELPAVFTDLFDESYLHPPDTISLDSPYLSPGVAPTALLKHALPQEIIMHTCEYDMLLDEGIAFKDRLEGAELGKTVTYIMIEGVPHGWDKAPNPLKPTPGVREHYLRACKEMRRVFGQQAGVQVREHQTKAGPSAAPRGSVQIVR